MFAFGSTIMDSTTIEDNQLIVGAVSAAAILAMTTLYHSLDFKDGGREFPKLRGIQLYHAWKFFRRRHDFFHSTFERNPGKNFSFSVLHHDVIALTGEDARLFFYSNSRLHFSEGYKILMGAIPRLSDVDIGTEEIGDTNAAQGMKRLNRVMSRARVQDALPKLVQDITDKVAKWGKDGKTGRINPFTDIYHLVFAMTARIFTCHDLTTNEADLEKIEELFMTLQTGATPTSLLFPWFPSPSRNAVKQATTELYTILCTYVETRRHAELTSDAIDVLIDDGETTQDIVGFIMGILFAGVVNTGDISCWALTHLATHPEWKEKCRKEIQSLLSRHAGDSSSATLSEKLKTVPISAWEDELPTLEACIRETQRITISTIALRRNVREEMKISEKVIKLGDFLAYPLVDAHLNPEYYPEPYKYDPGRWLRPDPVPNVAHPFLAWGAGKHPCTGMKTAKLEIKLVLTMLLAGYEFDPVDENGKFPDPLPVPDRNNIHRARPLGATCYLNFEKVAQ